MVGLGSELTRKAGPLPVWAWAGLGTVGLGAYLLYRKKQNMNAAANQTPTDQSSVTGAPSNLTTQAEPMPLQLGDTFVSPGNTTNNINLPAPPSTKTNPPPKHPPTLPTVNPAKFPAKVAKNSALGKSMIKIGCWDANGHYTGKNVSGHVPVYGFSAAANEYAQGPLATSKGHCDFIPGQFKAYII